MAYEVVCADVRDWAKSYAGEPFHAMVCDPPYALGFMGKRWDSDIAFRPETWAALARHLHPGAFGFAFASSRGWHRLAAAIEDAGLIIHPSLFGFCFGSGFPKATRIKDARFDGHRYGLQALKSAIEPIICFQKPYQGRPVDSITRTGAGALNVDAGRVGTDTARGERYNGKPPLGGKSRGIFGDYQHTQVWDAPAGRWPSNFLLLDEGAAAALDAQSGESANGYRVNRSTPDASDAVTYGMSGSRGERGYQDSGGASRFFFRVQEQIDEADPVHYCAKADRGERDAGLDDMPERRGAVEQYDSRWKEGVQSKRMPLVRNTHPTVKPLSLAKYLCSLLLPPADYAPRRILVPFAGSGSEMIGGMMAGFEQVVGIERESEYVELAQARLIYWERQVFGDLFLPLQKQAEAEQVGLFGD